jgi:hypothetical protein
MASYEADPKFNAFSTVLPCDEDVKGVDQLWERDKVSIRTFPPTALTIDPETSTAQGPGPTRISGARKVLARTKCKRAITFKLEKTS